LVLYNTDLSLRTREGEKEVERSTFNYFSHFICNGSDAIY
jgi:hypothetical protein